MSHNFGGHVGSRGSLASVRYGAHTEDISEIPEEDLEWEQMVITASLTHEEAFTLYWHNEWLDEDFEVISSLWDIYHRVPRAFNPDCFSPHDH